jgi:hypothetical protein
MLSQTRYVYFIVGVVGFIVFLLVALVLGVTLVAPDSGTTPLVTAVVGIIAAVIPSLLALLKVEKVHQEIIDQNGHIAALEQTAQTVQQTSAEAAAAMRDLKRRTRALRDGSNRRTASRMRPPKRNPC